MNKAGSFLFFCYLIVTYGSFFCNLTMDNAPSINWSTVDFLNRKPNNQLKK